MHDQKPQDSFGVALGEIRSDVKHMLTAQADTRQYMREQRTELQEALTKQDARITRIEQFQWKMAGVLAVFGVGFPVAVSVIINLLGA